LHLEHHSRGIAEMRDWSCANLGIEYVQLQHFSIKEGRKLAG
jgi:hypothetical protein